jgi:hypothetical protein
MDSPGGGGSPEMDALYEQFVLAGAVTGGASSPPGAPPSANANANPAAEVAGSSPSSPPRDGSTMPTDAEVTATLRKFATERDGSRLSLPQVDSAITELFPALRNKPALMRAYKAADRSGHGWIHDATTHGYEGSLLELVSFLVYFVTSWDSFNRMAYPRMTRPEFVEGCGLVGLGHLSEQATDQTFQELAGQQQGTEDGGAGDAVTFDAFCSWCARSGRQLRESGVVRGQQPREEGSGGGGGHSPRPDLKTLFRSIDTDGSGTLGVRQIAQLTEQMGRVLSAEELARTMLKLDHDGNGEVSLEEFEVWWEGFAKTGWALGEYVCSVKAAVSAGQR